MTSQVHVLLRNLPQVCQTGKDCPLFPQVNNSLRISWIRGGTLPGGGSDLLTSLAHSAEASQNSGLAGNTVAQTQTNAQFEQGYQMLLMKTKVSLDKTNASNQKQRF